MNKKLLGIFFIATTLLLAFPAKAEIVWTQIGTGDRRLKTDTVTKIITPVLSGSTTNGTNITTGTVTNTGTIIATTTPITYTGTEFQQSLAWMYANGLTKYNNETEYRPEDGLSREEAAKIIGQAYIKLGYNQDTKNTSCGFADSSQVDPTLANFVVDTCKRGIFKGTTDNKFLPTEKLTRPQAMALLVRVFEGKVSNESRTPRWGDYYIKGQALGLTTLNNQTAFDSNITRREIAIYIYRFKNIVSNETIKLMMLNKLNELGTTNQTFDTGTLNNFGSLADSLSINNDPELLAAIRWMNDNGLTNFKTIQEYKPFEILNREQAAKILYNFGEVFKFMGTQNNVTANCVFKDVSDIDASLITYVEQVCTYGIMNGSDGYFNPKGTINKSQFIAAIIRFFEGKKLDETTIPRRKAYFEKAQDMGMIGPADAVTFENPITRYEVALFLYRFKVKYQILQNMNNNTIQNQIVSTVPGSIKTGANNMLESNVYVDMNLLQNGNFDVGYIEIFNQRYKIVKSNIKEYFTDNFERFGNIFTLDTEVNTGTTSFIVSDLSLIEGTIRIGESSTFNITPINNTNAYYKITKTK
ncbi:MAG: S-layer homology domain-containing protein [Candidatus Absconditabacterales bacterium]